MTSDALQVPGLARSICYLRPEPTPSKSTDRHDGAAPPGAERVPPPWGGVDIFLALLTGLVLATVVGVPLFLVLTSVGQGPSPTVGLVTFGIDGYACLSLTTWWFCLRRRGAPWASVGFARPPWGAVAAMVPLSIGLLFANGVLVVLTSFLLGGLENPQGEALAPGGVLSTPSFLLLFFLVALVAPVSEEMIFRGVLYRYLRARRGVASAVALSAAAFALAHVVPVLLLALFVLGIALALVAERSSSLYPAIALHALNNGISLTLLYAASTRM
jgi:membrane protease YdiL (CAAX protease family)